MSDRPGIGLRYMAESALYFSVMSALVKLAGRRGVPWEEIVFARSLFALVVTALWLRAAKIPMWGNRRDILVLRGLLGVVGLMAFYYSVTHLPLGDATVIQYTNPAFVAVIAAIFLRERITWPEVGGVVMCLAGVALIAQPAFLFGGAERLPAFDVAIALVAAVTSAMAYTTVRKLGQTEHPLVTVFFFPLVATPICMPLALSTGYIPDAVDVAVLLGVGLSSQLAQVRLTQGLKLEPAGPAMAVTYLQVVFAFAWGVLLFGEHLTWESACGAAVVLLATLGLARRRATAARGV